MLDNILKGIAHYNYEQPSMHRKCVKDQFLFLYSIVDVLIVSETDSYELNRMTLLSTCLISISIVDITGVNGVH